MSDSTGTPLGSPEATGYHAETIIYEDSDVGRNDLTRWLDVLIGSALILIVGYAIGTLLGWVVLWGFSWVSDLLGRVGLVASMFFLSWLLPKRGLLIVPETQGYVSLDPLEPYYRGILAFMKDGENTGSMVVRGPGIFPTHWWEERGASGNHSTENVTVKFTEDLPTKTSALKVASAMQYQASLPNMRKFHNNGASTIQSGLESFVRSFLSIYMADKDADWIKDNLRAVNGELAQIFRGNATGNSAVTKFEEGYGIHITMLALEGVDFPSKVQAARDAREEAAQMRHIISENSGLTDQEIREMARNNPQEYKDLLHAALVQSDNADMSVRVIQGTLAAGLAAAVEGMINNSGGGGSSQRPRRPKNQGGAK